MLSVLALALLVFALPAAAATSGKGKSDEKSTKHDFRSKMQKKDDALRARALELKLKGKLKGEKIAKLGKKDYVELEREGTDKVFVVIAEFGLNRHPAYPDANSDGSPASDALTFDGPLHNSIPKPGPKDNTTLWQKDYSQSHYENMYFNRMAAYYEAQSSGRYSVAGDVTAWVKVPFNEARYGRDVCGGIVCNNTWFLIRDAMAFWVKGQLDAGKTLAEVATYLKTFDVQDRYDVDGDGVFAEPDSFIDHFQIVHAGGDQAAGDPNQGSDAIWSHRWYANLSSIYGEAPNGLPGTPVGGGGTSGGQSIPENQTGVWVGDYTIQPENGGLGVFAHEFGHDLGLPDLYDTSGNTGGAENSTGFWSLMSSGANIGDGSNKGIGDAPTDMGVWEKFQLGWLGCGACAGGRFYDVAFAGGTSTHELGPAEHANTKKQALFVVLPDKETTLALGTPPQGSYAFWSTMGDDLSTSMTKTSGIAAGPLTASVKYEIEEDWDYAFLETSSNSGSTWTPLETSLSDDAGDQSGFNGSHTGITGTSGGAYVPLTATLPAGTNALRVRYQTDGAVAESGFLIDDIAIGGTVVGNAETASEGWTFAGFKRTTGNEVETHFNAYVGENRGYRSYDTSLKTAYNFGFLDVNGDLVETFPYQDGLLISYWDESFGDNNVGDHPGGGLVLPVDAHPTFAHHADGHLMRPRILTFDSTFGLEPTDAITINKNSQPVRIASQPAAPQFDDTKDYWFASDGHPSAPASSADPGHVGRYEPSWVGVKVPKTGTTITVTGSSKKGDVLAVTVAPK